MLLTMIMLTFLYSCVDEEVAIKGHEGMKLLAELAEQAAIRGA